ncbi:unnamed protein product [Amoebophrya sp. A25]|nr:unnamed protein product [Amoebophrya sp. A25]|eukprot:GSA25T00013061001.1
MVKSFFRRLLSRESSKRTDDAPLEADKSQKPSDSVDVKDVNLSRKPSASPQSPTPLFYIDQLAKDNVFEDALDHAPRQDGVQKEAPGEDDLAGDLVAGEDPLAAVVLDEVKQPSAERKRMSFCKSGSRTSQGSTQTWGTAATSSDTSSLCLVPGGEDLKPGEAEGPGEVPSGNYENGGNYEESNSKNNSSRNGARTSAGGSCSASSSSPPPQSSRYTGSLAARQKRAQHLRSYIKFRHALSTVEESSPTTAADDPRHELLMLGAAYSSPKLLKQSSGLMSADSLPGSPTTKTTKDNAGLSSCLSIPAGDELPLKPSEKKGEAAGRDRAGSKTASEQSSEYALFLSEDSSSSASELENTGEVV